MTTTVDLTSNDDVSQHYTEVAYVVTWCASSDFMLSTAKTLKFIIDSKIPN